MNNQIPETDQWKLNGNCDKCRRVEYCSHKCAAKKGASRRELRRIAELILDGALPPRIADKAKDYLP